MVKLEIGGGIFPLGDGWVNLDKIASADVVHNLEECPWPFADDSVDQIYTSHCIEHVSDPVPFLQECARIGKIGTRVEIRCPAPTAHLAMVADHKHVFSLQCARNMDIHFPHLFWTGAKRLTLRGFRLQSSEMLAWAKRDLPFLRNISDDKIMMWIPGTAHESVFDYEVTANG